MSDSFDSSIVDIPQTGDESLTFATPTNQHSLTQQSLHHTTSTLSHEHLSSQHQLTQCLHVTHNTILKLRQTLKIVTLDQNSSQLLALHLQKNSRCYTISYWNLSSPQETQTCAPYYFS